MLSPLGWIILDEEGVIGQMVEREAPRANAVITIAQAVLQEKTK